MSPRLHRNPPLQLVTAAVVTSPQVAHCVPDRADVLVLIKDAGAEVTDRSRHQAPRGSDARHRRQPARAQTLLECPQCQRF
eukprot:9486399-Pyramimonas_sp.AAC.2